MLSNEKVAEIKEYLQNVAQQQIPQDEDDFMINDYTGGNIDDAYYLGDNAGRVLFARELLEMF